MNLNKNKIWIVSGIAVLAIALVFQNCSDGAFQSALSTNNTAGSSSTGSGPLPPVPVPVSATSTIVSLLENKGPLSGDHLLKITSTGVPTTGKKVEIKLGNNLCLKLVVVSDKEIDCITPASTAAKVDVSLFIDGVQTSQIAMGYEYAASEAVSATLAVPAIPFRTSYSSAEANGNVYVWGGDTGSPNFTAISQGVVYNSATNTWDVISMTGQPTVTSGSVAVSNGTSLIVWGGITSPDLVYSNTGGRYDFATKTWKATSTTGAPIGRSYASAVWTGSKMIVWGGASSRQGNNQVLEAGGGIYDPATDTWKAITPSTSAGINAAWFHFTYWDGKEMFVWGGYNSGAGNNNNDAPTNVIGAYDPALDKWRKIDVTNAYPTTFTTDFGMTWYSGTKFIALGLNNVSSLGNETMPKYLADASTAWVDFPAGMLPAISNPLGSLDRYSTAWTGRYLVIIKDGGASGFKYSFP